MKKNVLILFTLFIANCANAQSLTIEETLDYLNEILLNHKSHTSYQSIKLNGEGKIIFKHYNSNYIEEIDLINGKLDEITSINYDEEPYIRIRLKYYAIQRVNVKENIKKNNKYFDIRIKNIDINTNKKFTNALKYLTSLILTNEKYNEIDDAPFATNNFNPNAFEIISDKDNGEVKLTKNGGVYHIDISIGGIIESFVFDTGASNVLISKNLERKLISKGVLKKEIIYKMAYIELLMEV